MRIGIIGGGAIGLLCAAMFSKKGIDVQLYTRTQEQANLINEKKVVLKESDYVHELDILATVFSGEVSGVDVLFITVKQYHLPLVLEQLNVCEKVPVIFLQNGMGHEDVIKNKSNFYLGIVEHGAKKVSANKVIFTGKGRIVLGMNDEMNVLQRVTKICGDQFLIEYDSDIEFIMKRKLVANACINPLTGLLGVKNGELIHNERYNRMMKKLYDEVLLVLDIHSKEELWEYVCGICKKTKLNTSSMLSDLQQGSRTEVDAILGYLIKKSIEKNVPIPVIRFIYDGIKGIELEGRRGC